MECNSGANQTLMGIDNECMQYGETRVCFYITEQRIVDRRTQIRKKQQLTKLKLNEIQRRIEDEPHVHVPSDSKSEDEQWLLGFNEKGGGAFLKDVRMIRRHW